MCTPHIIPAGYSPKLQERLIRFQENAFMTTLPQPWRNTTGVLFVSTRVFSYLRVNSAFTPKLNPPALSTLITSKISSCRNSRRARFGSSLNLSVAAIARGLGAPASPPACSKKCGQDACVPGKAGKFAIIPIPKFKEAAARRADFGFRIVDFGL